MVQGEGEGSAMMWVGWFFFFSRDGVSELGIVVW